MRVIMVTGVRNEGQPGALECQRGRAGAGMTEPLTLNNHPSCRFLSCTHSGRVS
jgi:hypothetical protein